MTVHGMLVSQGWPCVLNPSHRSTPFCFADAAVCIAPALQHSLLVLLLWHCLANNGNTSVALPFAFGGEKIYIRLIGTDVSPLLAVLPPLCAWHRPARQEMVDDCPY